MNDLPRQKLIELIAKHGRELYDDPRRTEGFLRDLCGQHKREIFVLVSAQKAQVATDLLARARTSPPATLLALLVRRLVDDLALSEEAARWAVESWALALGMSFPAAAGADPGAEAGRTPRPAEPLTGPASSAPAGLLPYYLTEHLAAYWLSDFPRLCDADWPLALSEFEGGHIQAHLERWEKALNESGRRPQARQCRAAIEASQRLRSKAGQDELERNAALEAFVYALGGVPAPQLRVEAADLGAVGQGEAARGTLAVCNARRGYLSGAARSSAPWLHVSPARFGCQAQAPATLTLQADTAGLRASPAGELHAAEVHLETNGGQAVVRVQVLVRAPLLTVSAAPIDFGPLIDRAAGRASLQVGNAGPGVLVGQVQSDAPWLRAEPATFRCPAQQTTDLTLHARTDELPAGRHETQVHLTSNGGARTVAVAVTVALRPVLAVTPDKLSFRGWGAVAGQTHTPPQTVEIKNVGYGMLRATLTGQAHWLRIAPQELTVGEQQAAQAQVQVDLQRLGPEGGQSEIRVAAEGGTARVVVTARRRPNLRCTPSGLAIAAPEYLADLLALPEPPPRVWWEKAEMEFCLAPAGEFLMGSADSDRDARPEEKPQHKVYLDAYYIGRYPVTNAQYARFVQQAGHRLPNGWDAGRKAPPAGKEKHPVVYVSWDDAQAYCQWAGLRLSSEAEWEKAASWDFKTGRKRLYPWGDTWDSGKCNTSEGGKGGTTPVGAYSPAGDSPCGCADMSGNVWEWAADWYDEKYYDRSSDRNPTGPESGTYGRVLRGGAWNFRYRARSAYRLGSYPDHLSSNFGFRVCVLGVTSSHRF